MTQNPLKSIYSSLLENMGLHCNSIKEYGSITSITTTNNVIIADGMYDGVTVQILINNNTFGPFYWFLEPFSSLYCISAGLCHYNLYSYVVNG